MLGDEAARRHWDQLPTPPVFYRNQQDELRSIMTYEKSEKSENEDFKLIRIAQNAVARNLSPYETSQLLRGMDKTQLQQFFIYYTALKKGKVTDEHYENTVQEFKTQFDSEMIKKQMLYVPALKDSLLGKALLEKLEENAPSYTI